MQHYLTNAAEIEEVEVFFLRFANKNAFNLRLMNYADGSAFEFKSLWGLGSGESLRKMEVDINGHGGAVQEVRFDRSIDVKGLHEILEQTSVPHDYQADRHELGLSLLEAKNHLQAAFDKLHEPAVQPSKIAPRKIIRSANTASKDRAKPGGQER
jgi:hypothetical protein